MSVKLLDNDAFYGYRVRRTVDGKLFQEYFSLKKDGKRMTGAARKRVENAAMRRDKALAKEQLNAKHANKAERCFNANGSVRGISYLVKTEKSGTKTPIFQVGIASEKDGKIICTSYSINAHGKKAAWEMAVATFAQHKDISKSTKLYKQLLAAMPGRVSAVGSNKRKKAAKKSSKKKAAKKTTKKSSKKKVAKKASKKSVTRKKLTKKAVKSKVAKKKVKKKKARKKARK